MRAWKSLVFISFVTLVGCECAPLGVHETRFSCTGDDECVTGFVCLDVGQGLECVPEGTEPVDAGDDAGAADDAGVDAGGPDAGDDSGSPDAGDVDSGDDAGFDAGEPLDAGALSLHFLTTQQNVPLNTCSGITLVEARSDGVAWQVPSLTEVSLSSTPGGVRFFENPMCSGAGVSTVVINQGGDNVDFYMRASDAGVYSVRAAANGFAPASQEFEVGVTPTIITLAGIPGSVPGGKCQQVVVELRRAGALVNADMPVPVSLSAVNASQVRFYSSSSCTSTTTSVTIPMGASAAQFWMKPMTGGTQTVIATAAFDGDQATFTTNGVVRRFGCWFNASSVGADGGTVAGTTSRTCTFSPSVTDMNAAVLFSQFSSDVGSNGSVPSSGATRCRLTANNAVTCNRVHDLTAGEIYVQVAEIPQGFRVQRFAATSANCTGSQLTQPQDGGAFPFVVRSLSSTTNVLNGNHLGVARYEHPALTNTPPNCFGYEHQVAEWAGVTVTTGELDGGFPAGERELEVTSLPAVSTNALVLVQAGTLTTGGIPVCSSLVRGDLTTPTSLTLTRGAGDAGCPFGALTQVSWQRIDFGPRAHVDTYQVDFAPNQTTRQVTSAPVDTTRTIMLASNQSFGGQGVGETDDPSMVRVSSGNVRFSLPSSTRMDVTRGTSGNAAKVTVYVVELVP